MVTDDTTSVKAMLLRLVDVKRAEIERQQEALNQLQDEARGLETAVAMIEANPMLADLGMVASVDRLNQLASEGKRCEAVVYLAEQNGGILNVTPARKLLELAGIVDPDDGPTAMARLIQSAGRFEQVKRGQYRLVPAQPEAPAATPDVVDSESPNID